MSEIAKLTKENMIDHVILTVSDFKRSVAFYAKALKPLGITTFIDYEGKDGHPDLKGFGDGKRHFFWLKEGKPDPQAVHVGFVAKDQVQDHFTCDLQSHWCPKVLFDQSQREVHTGCYPCGRVRVSIGDVDWVRIDSCVLKLVCHLRRPFPMCRRRFAVQKPGRSKQEGAGTDGANAAHSLSGFLQPQK